MDTDHGTTSGSTTGTSGTGSTTGTGTTRSAPAPGPSARALLARLPRYQQIAEELRAQIESGQLAPGEPIPSETALMDRYSVSRITARAAVRDLRASGLVITEQGRATRVRDTPTSTVDLNPTIHTGITDPSTQTDDGQWFGTWDQAWTVVEEPSRYRSVAKGPAARFLALPDATPVFVTERLLTTGGTVLAHTLYLPVEVCADIAALAADPFAAPADLYAVLTAAGHRLRWTDTVTARMPTPDEANALDMSPGLPLLIHHRTTHITPSGTDEAGGRAALYEQTRLNPQRITLTHAAPHAVTTDPDTATPTDITTTSGPRRHRRSRP